MFSTVEAATRPIQPDFLEKARQAQCDRDAAAKLAFRACERLTLFANGLAGVGDCNPSARQQHYAEAVELAAQVCAIMGPRPSTSADLAAKLEADRRGAA